MSMFSSVIIVGLSILHNIVNGGDLVTLWPMPETYTNGSVTATLCNGFKFTYKGNSVILNDGLERFYGFIGNKPNEYIMNYNGNSKYSGNDVNFNICSGNINVISDDESLELNTDVSYSLDITASVININSQTVFGALYGLTTLEQLILYDSVINMNIINNIPWEISDKPYYNHRGLMIDTSRNYLSISMIKKLIVGMSYNKLNVLHMHLTDATSFPFYSKSHPELSQKGAYPNRIYYPSNITDIITFAKSYGIRVIPEFDTPGHEYSITNSNPDVMTCNTLAYQTSNTCPEPPCGYLQPNNSDAFTLIEEVFEDAYQVFNDSFFHLGGDEVNPSCWGPNTNSLYETWMKHFVDILNTNNKSAIIWSGNIIIDSNVGQQTTNVYIQNWGNTDEKLSALEKGYYIIDSNYQNLYLDCGAGSWLYPEGNSWCQPYKSWGNIYNYSLTDGIPSTYHSKIIGAEVCIWGEQADDGNIEQKVWPRGSAAAEKWWSNKQWASNKDMNDVITRIAIQRNRMLYRGIMSNPIQPDYCTLYPKYCNYYRNGITNKYK